LQANKELIGPVTGSPASSHLRTGTGGLGWACPKTCPIVRRSSCSTPFWPD